MLLFAAFAISMASVQAQDSDEEDGEEEVEEGGCQWNCPDGEDNGWCWGKEPDKAKEKNVLYSDYLMMKKYKEAVEPLEWLLANTPNLNKAIYINGDKIFRALEKAAADEAEERLYQDKHLAVIDARIRHFCEERSMMQKKGQYAFGYWVGRGKEDKTYYDSLYQLYDRIYALAGKNTKRTNLTYYMQMTKIMFQLKKIDEDRVFANYDAIIEAIDFNIEKNKDKAKEKAKWEKAADAVNALLEGTLDITCDVVKSKWGEKIAKEGDLKLAKKALRFMIKDKCTDDPLFMTVAELIQKNEPSLGIAVVLYKKYLAASDYETAGKYIEEALSLSSGDPSKQAEIYEDRGDMMRTQDKWTAARADYNKAVEIDAARAATAYSKIGSMYMGSFKACLSSADADPVKDRAVYFAAYDMFAKAGDRDGMNRAAGQFPTKADIFLYANKGYKEGGSISVGCWIGGTTTIRAR
jgi:hypothetical protein